jgi:chemotaxis protein CheD
MANIVVSISDLKISQKPGDVLVTYSLGSCVGVAAWDPLTRAGGLIHCLLPLSTTAPERAQQNPYMFVNTGVGALLKALFRLGASRERLVLKAAGGANMAASEFGVTIPRTLTLFLDSGRVTVKTLGEEHEL